MTAASASSSPQPASRPEEGRRPGSVYSGLLLGRPEAHGAEVVTERPVPLRPTFIGSLAGLLVRLLHPAPWPCCRRRPGPGRAWLGPRAQRRCPASRLGARAAARPRGSDRGLSSRGLLVPVGGSGGQADAAVLIQSWLLGGGSGPRRLTVTSRRITVAPDPYSPGTGPGQARSTMFPRRKPKAESLYPRGRLRRVGTRGRRPGRAHAPAAPSREAVFGRWRDG